MMLYLIPKQPAKAKQPPRLVVVRPTPLATPQPTKQPRPITILRPRAYQQTGGDAA